MKYRSIIIDGHNLFYRSFVIDLETVITNSDVIYTGGINNFLKRVKQLKDEFGYTDSKVFILFDNPTSTLKIRQLIDENYKSHRLNNNKYTKEIYRTITYLIEILRNYFDDTFILKVDNCEADDLVPLVLKYNKTDSLVVSADLDWARNVSAIDDKHIVSWYNYKKLYTADVFKNEYKFYPSGNRIKLYKSFRGDSSDNITPAVPYIPEDILLYIIDKYHEIEIDKLTSVILRDSFISSKWRTAIRNADRDIRKNYRLVDFVIIDDDIDDYIQVCKRNKALARIWFSITGLNVEAWMTDIKKPDNFLSIETFKNPSKRKKF